MSKNYINPVGKPLDFRLQPSQFAALARHRLTDDEPIVQVVNRQLRRLVIALALKSAPTEPKGEESGGAKHCRVRLESDPVEKFVEKVQQGRKIDTPQIALRHLLIWSNDLPPQKSFSNSQELYEAILGKYEAGDMILIRSVIASAIDRCTIAQAKAWLWSLAQDGRVKLRIPAESLRDRTTIRLPDENSGNLYAWIEVV